MKDLSAFLNEREIYILENYPQKTLKVLGEELGITNVRVKQIRDYAKRKIREQKRIEQEQDIAPVFLPRTLERRDAWVVLRALENYSECIYKEWYVDVDPKRVKMEPDYMATQALIEVFQEALRHEAPDAQTGDYVSGQGETNGNGTI